MYKILNDIFINEYKHFEDLVEYKTELHKYRKNSKLLKNHISKNQKKILLRMIDSKDLMEYERGFNSFLFGFKIGLKFGYETNRSDLSLD